MAPDSCCLQLVLTYLLCDTRKRKLRSLSFRLWTFPVLVDGPFGVVSAAEFIGIILFILYFVFSMTYYMLDSVSFVSSFHVPLAKSCELILSVMGIRFGIVGLFCMSFLFLPVSRGSVLLRLIDIPFEHATRYHVWLGHLTMALFTLHGLCYVISWSLAGRLIEETSYENTFHDIHDPMEGNRSGKLSRCDQLGSWFADVDDIASPSLRYNALSFIFVQVRELSFLQWHPFSVSSSPMDGRYHISILIKALGTWTDNLKSIITDVEEKTRSNCGSDQSQRITASIEGPYGHESPYHLMYENLILAAGGIGISPFLAILSDIIHRVEQGMPCEPRNVLVLWSVKKSTELSLLSAVDAQSISSSVSDKLHLDIQAFVTQEIEPPLEDGIVEGDQKIPSIFVKNGSAMSGLVGTGDNFWAAMYFAASTLGTVLAYALVQVYYVKRFTVYAWWHLGLLLLLCMVAGVALPGGLVVLLWHLSEKRRMQDNRWEADAGAGLDGAGAERTRNGAGGAGTASAASLAALWTTRYGCRPKFQAEFTAFVERVGGAAADVGVLVCGPSGLQTSVARECRSQNLHRGGGKSGAVFHFNSHSFDF
ncbi:hypothetical protein ACQ4PT_009967 [Festuca glaucescens]